MYERLVQNDPICYSVELLINVSIFEFRWSSWYGTELEPRCQVPVDELEDMRTIGRQTKDILDKHSEFCMAFSNRYLCPHNG